MRMRDTIQKLTTVLRNEIPPGLGDDELPSTYPRPSVYRPSAVLVTLVEHNGEAHIILTERTAGLTHHAGQISFPGGSCEENDADAVATALRESEEEIGLPPSDVQVLGALADYPTRTGFMITPIVGHLASLPELTPDPAEVAGILLCPLSVFHRRAHRIDKIEVNGYEHHFHAYDTPAGVVWGATAGILVSLNRLLG